MQYDYILSFRFFSITITAIAAGMMIAASYSLIHEGCTFEDAKDTAELSVLVRTGIGAAIGLVFINVTERVLADYEDLTIGGLGGADAKRALLIFFVMTLHSFSEGVGIGVSFGGSHGSELGVFISTSLAVHNIPEGVSIAVPCIAARPDSPWLAFGLSALSGLAEPLGAFVALFVLRKIDANPQEPEIQYDICNMENVLAFVAGIMIMVALAELFPEARRHAKDSNTPLITGTLCGMVLMLATELYLA